MHTAGSLAASKWAVFYAARVLIIETGWEAHCELERSGHP
jgi:hypothetical protein